MENIAEQGSRALSDMADLIDLLRLSHEALQRIENNIHGDSYTSAEKMSCKLHDLRHDADNLSKKVEEYVKEIETKAYG